MKGYYWKADTSFPAGILLLLFSLFASISFTPSEYADCGSLFPDENPEIYGICKVFQKQFSSPPVTTLTAISCTPKHFWTSHHFLEGFFPQRTKFQTDLVTILCC
jgi:hypothetical protein